MEAEQKHGSGQGRRKDHAGMRYDRVVALRYDPSSPPGNVRWICRCDCGTETSIRAVHLRRKSLSCGCRRRSPKNTEGLTTGEWLVYTATKRGAQKRKIPMSLTSSDVATLIRMDCVYCGSPPRKRDITHKGYTSSVTANGIDRIDSSRGYEVGNVQPCCRMCNVAKLDHSEADFIAWLLRAADYIRSKP